jgi:6-phosphofructokinase 1
VGFVNGEIIATPLTEVVTKKKPLDLRLLELARMLAR